LVIGNLIYGTGINGTGTTLSSGNIGLSVTSPATKLHVAGSIRIDTSAASTAGQLQLMNPARTFQTNIQAGAQTANITYTLPTTAPTAGQVLSSDASGNMSWVASATSTSLSSITAATATNSINSSSFGQTWQWNTLAGTSALTLSTTSTAAASNAQTLLNLTMSGANATSTQTTYGAQISNTHTGTSSTNVGLSVSASGGTNNYGLLVPNGNVGIGMTTPSYTVDVNGSFEVASGSGYFRTWGGNEVDIEYSGGSDGGMAFRNNGSTVTGFTAFKNASNTHLLHINNDGNVGIGTASPSYRLDVSDGDLRLTNNSSYLRTWGECDIEYDGGPDGYMAFRNNATNNGKTRFWNASGTSLLTIQNNGNIGVNTDSPSQMIHTINGNILIDNNDNTARELRFDEPSGSGTNYTAFKAQAQATNITYTLPASDGASGASLVTNGSGALSWSSVGAITFVRKTSDESVTNSTSLQNDDDLDFSIGANQTWEVEVMMRVYGGNGDIKFALTLPAGASMWVSACGDENGSADDYLEMTVSGTGYAFNPSGPWNLSTTGSLVHLKGVVVTGGTAGTVQLRWAQNVSDGTATVVKSMS
ncbi:MAG: hypothetical protein JNL32_15895, partial [Candidatus Kapabacteria bacterium]|nr:hypothetical protein [Candidatus Kapabacteria bacterium]